MSRPVWARVDLNALHSNLNRVRALAPRSRVLAVVKANAYGHGAVDVARAVSCAVDGFAVAGIDEAENLASAGITSPIFMLSGFHETSEIELIAGRGFIPVVHTFKQLERLEAYPLPARVSVWAKFDTGMHRIGFEPDLALVVLERLRGIARVTCLGVMSHLACADDADNPRTREQVDSFEGIAGVGDLPRSLANSAGICAWPSSHFDWVRPGIMLYGCTPLLDRDGDDLGLRPVMTLAARVIAVTRRSRGDPVGYGGDWRCPEDMRVGVVACGYADGYPRHAPSGTPVWAGGKRTGVVGRVSMDMTSIDLRGLDHVGVGDEVEMWGRNVTATEVSKYAGTIAYELLSGVTGRVPRVVVADG